jgi:general stress protein YciG
MAGTVKGGKQAANTNKKRYGKDFYATIGKKGGTLSRGGGFAANRELARKAGARGGKISRRSAK